MKGCSAFLTLILLVAFVSYVVYNESRREQTKKEISAVTSRLHVTSRSPVAGGDLVTPLATAQKHIVKAREMLRRNKVTAAQNELDEALKSLTRANNVSRDMVGDLAVLLGKTRESLMSAYQKALTDISTEIKSQQKSKIDVAR